MTVKLNKVLSVIKLYFLNKEGKDVDVSNKKQFDNIIRCAWEDLKQIDTEGINEDESDDEDISCSESDVDSDTDLDMSEDVENALDGLLLEWDVYDTFIKGRIERKMLENIVNMKVKYDKDKEFKKKGFPISFSGKEGMLIVTFEHGDDETKKIKLKEKELSEQLNNILDFILHHM